MKYATWNIRISEILGILWTKQEFYNKMELAG